MLTPSPLCRRPYQEAHMNFQFFHDRQEAIAVSLGPSRPTAQEEKEEYINRRRPHLRLGLSLALVLGALLAGSNVALANGTTRWVNGSGTVFMPPGTSCNQPGYLTIQLAVNAAAPYDRINVCPGTYTEQVTIPAGKNNIQLRSVKQWRAVIKAPQPSPAAMNAIVEVSTSQNVTILAFTITGPGMLCTLQYGVRVDSGGSANILGNHITQIRDTSLNCQSMGLKGGEAVRVGRMTEAAVGSAQVIGNVIDNYERNGVTVDNAGSSAGITHNRIFGVKGSSESQNGIQVSRGATATVRHNFVSLNVFGGPQVVASTGILLFFPGTTPSAPLTDHNTVASNDQGLYMWGSGSGTTTSHNRVRASGFEGVVLNGATSSEVGYNKSDYNGTSGIKAFNNSNSNSVHNNKATNNGANGILLGEGCPNPLGGPPDCLGANGNTVSQNKISDNGTVFLAPIGSETDGIHINGPSTFNIIDSNHLRHNVTYDCADWSAGDTWTDNDGQTQAPMPSTAVCTEDDNDSDYADDDYGWYPNDPWYNNFDGALSYDWVDLYATIDTDSILGLLPQLPPVLGIPVPAE